uniref:DUF4440 domain-containing protein n=1 Tax=Plectus sambesii TaxID=2011161 RepID=A0A914UIB3_9BILA
MCGGSVGKRESNATSGCVIQHRVVRSSSASRTLFDACKNELADLRKTPAALVFGSSVVDWSRSWRPSPPHTDDGRAAMPRFTTDDVDRPIVDMAEEEYMQLMLASMRVNRSVMEDAQKKIVELSRTLTTAVAEADLPAVLDMYDEDAELLATGMPPCCGKGAVRTYYEAALNAKMQMTERRPFEVTNPAPLWAFERGHYTIELKGRISKGRYFVLWKRLSAGWRIIQECRNDGGS